MGRFSRVLRRQAIDRGPLLPIAALLLAAVLGAGCGEELGTTSTVDDNGGLLLPPGFKTVDLPVETRKAIFREVHIARSLAVQEANQKLPLEDPALPKTHDVYQKRSAEHRAMFEGILAKTLPALAERHKISMADLAQIEEEARRLRWNPPEEPKLEEVGPTPEKPGPTRGETKEEAM